MISLIKTLFSESLNNPNKVKRNILLASSAMYALNMFGIYRNSFTLWSDKSILSYFWLGSDILQLTFCTVVFFAVLLDDYKNKMMKKVLLYGAVTFFVLNFYNFLVNFRWLPYEGSLVFIFWFLNNGTMIAFCALIAYLSVVKMQDAA